MATTFTNRATLTYNGSEVLSNIAVGVLENALGVTKTAVGTSYTAGDTVTYVISIVNSGASAETDLTLTDDLGAYPFGAGTVQPLTYVDGSVQYYRDGILQAAPAVSTADGLSISGISADAGGSAVIVYAATVNEYAPLDSGAAIVNTVTVGTVEKAAAASAEETVTVAGAAQLSVVKSVSPVPVAENGQLTYTFRLLNFGNTAVTAADSAVIDDTFSPILSDISVSLDGEPLAPTTGYTYDEATGVFATADGVIAIPAATYEQDPATGAWTTIPGSATLTVTGTVGSIAP
jgi:uncharacterized repeat protein (TIGR01451 family)